MPPTTAQEQSSAARRAEILRTAAELFGRHGYRGTSIAAVARGVGLTDAGVLYHFRTKEELLLGVLEEHGREVEEGLERAGLEGIDLLRLVREWGVGMEARPEISSLLILITTEHLTADSPTRRFVQASYDRIRGRYVEAFAAAAARGDLRADLDPDQEASALVAHMDGIRLQWFLSDRAVSMATSVRAYVDGVLERLAPR